MLGKIKIITKQKKKLFNQVFLAIRNRRLVFAAFIRVSSGVFSILGAFIILFLMVNNPTEEENIVLYKAIMVVLALATYTTNWYYDYKYLIIRFKQI